MIISSHNLRHLISVFVAAIMLGATAVAHDARQPVQETRALHAYYNKVHSVVSSCCERAKSGAKKSSIAIAAGIIAGTTLAKNALVATGSGVKKVATTSGTLAWDSAVAATHWTKNKVDQGCATLKRHPKRTAAAAGITAGLAALVVAYRARAHAGVGTMTATAGALAASDTVSEIAQLNQQFEQLQAAFTALQDSVQNGSSTTQELVASLVTRIDVFDNALVTHGVAIADLSANITAEAASVTEVKAVLEQVVGAQTSSVQQLSVHSEKLATLSARVEELAVHKADKLTDQAASVLDKAADLFRGIGSKK